MLLFKRVGINPAMGIWSLIFCPVRSFCNGLSGDAANLLLSAAVCNIRFGAVALTLG